MIRPIDLLPYPLQDLNAKETSEEISKDPSRIAEREARSSLATNSEALQLDRVTRYEIETLRQWRNDQIAILRQSHALSSEEQQNYWEKVAFPQMEALKPPLLLFTYRQEGQLRGYGGIVHIDWALQSGELSSLIDTAFPEPSAPFLKLSKAFIELSIEIARNLGLKKLTTLCYDFRPEWIAMAEQIGFKRKGYVNECKQVKIGSISFSCGGWQHEYLL